MNHPDDRFFVGFLEAYSVEAFLNDLEELCPGTTRAGLLKGVAKVLTQKGCAQ
jgi:hypothetical protein